MSRFLFCLILYCTATPVVDAETRTWTSAEGGFELRGDLIAFNETTVILKRKGSGRLAAVELAELSQADREHVREQDSEAETDAEMQTWTSKEGLKMRARVLAYGQQDYTLGKSLGSVTINGKAFSRMDPLHQKIALRVLSEWEGVAMSDEADLSRFMNQRGGKEKTYPLEGVAMQLQSGDRIAVPFFLFSQQDLEALKPGWESWKQARASEREREREDLMMRTEAMEYQRRMAADAERRQMEVLKLNMLAAGTGLTSFWEVMMRPGPGVYGRPITAVVTAPNSRVATEMVLPKYPGYTLIGVRKASRY